MHLTLYGDTPSKKNSRAFFIRGGRPFFVAGKTYQKWHKEQKKALVGVQPIKDIVLVQCTLYAGTKRAGDLSNKWESIGDLLVDCGIIPDDNWFEVPLIHLMFGGVDRGNPRAEVSIYKKEDLP